MSLISQILVSSKDLVVDKKQSGKEKLSTMKENDVVKARVDKVLSNREVVLSFDGGKVKAKTFVPLKPGDEVMLKLSETKDNQVFKIVSKFSGNTSPDNLGAVKALGRGGPFQGLADMLGSLTGAAGEKGIATDLNQMVNLIKGFSLKSEEADAGFLKNLIRMSGMSFENNLFNIISSKTDMKDESVDAFMKMLFGKISDRNPQASKILTALNASRVSVFGNDYEVKQLLMGLMDRLVDMKTGMGISSFSQSLYTDNGDGGAVFTDRLNGVIDELSSRLLSDPIDGSSGNSVLKQAVENLFKIVIETDMKAYALKMTLEQSGEENPVHRQLSEFVDNLEQLQQANGRGADNAGRFLLPLPVLNGEVFKFGQLFLDLGKKKGEEGGKKEGIVNISFILQMSNLGDLIADFSVLNKGVNGSFGVEDEDSKRLFEDHFPELIQKLDKLGFTVYSIKCHVLGKDKLSDINLADRMTDGDEGGLSIII